MRPPNHLQPATKTWWTAVHTKYELTDSEELLLAEACEIYDQLAAARKLLRADGLVIPGREGGKRAHPAVAIVRDCSASFASLVKQLGLAKQDIPKPMGRPTTATRYADFAGHRNGNTKTG
jgi:P27 family predicted phage terminase small subunit